MTTWTGNFAMDCIANLAAILEEYKSQFGVNKIYTTSQEFSLSNRSLQIGQPNVEIDDLSPQGYTEIEMLIFYFHSKLSAGDREQEIVTNLDIMARIIKQDATYAKSGSTKSALNMSGCDLVSRGYGNAHFPPDLEIGRAEWWQGGVLVIKYRIPTKLLSRSFSIS